MDRKSVYPRRDRQELPESPRKAKQQPDTPYAAVCMMCGRNHGHLFQGKFFVHPGSATLERDGRRLRCGQCHGPVQLEPDPLFAPPIDPAELLAPLKRAAGHRSRSQRSVG